MKVEVVVNHEKFIPTYAHPGDSGADLRAAISYQLVIYPGEVKRVPVGVRAAVPVGYELQIRPRSGLSSRGLIVANAPGTIDAGYRGEVGVLLANISNGPLAIQPDERIAQAVLAPVIRAEFESVDELDRTARGEGGFGSTGQQ